jgi:hypothetical protein
MYSDPQLASPAPVLAPAAAPAPWLLRLIPGQALCEASVLRQLARAGLAVRRRHWAAATAPGNAPELVLQLGAATEAQARHAAQQLRQRTGAQVLCAAAPDSD